PEVTQLLLRKIWADSLGQIPFSPSPDVRVLVFNFAVSVTVGLLFSLAPALQFWRPDLVQTLKQQLTTASGGQLKLRRSSVALQMGLSLLLLFGAGLFVRTLHNLKNVDVGFVSDHLVTFGISPGYAGYQLNQNLDLYKRIIDTLAVLPGVRSAAATSDPELANNQSMRIVRNAKHRNLRREIEPTVYIPYMQVDPKNGLTYMQFYIRTWQAPEQAMNTIRTAMQNLDSKLVLDSLLTMDRQINNNVTNESIVAFLAVSFGILATFLAGIGLYGVLAFSTAQRTRESGIRMALGASRSSVVQMVLREVLWLAGISVVVAVPAALLLARYLRSQLYGVSNTDPLTLIGVVVVIAGVAMLAATLPARRAAGVNPTKALRYE